MNGRLKEGGIVSFWLPIYQVSLDETKAILRAFHNVFPNASLWATSDMEWVMVGIKPPVGKPDEELARKLFTDPSSGKDLARCRYRTAPANTGLVRHGRRGNRPINPGRRTFG